MKKNFLIICFAVLTIVFATQNIVYGQKYQAVQSQITVQGTSNVHPWKMTAVNSDCTAELSFKDGRLTRLQSAKFSLAVKDLKGDAALMNQRAYRALKSYPYDRIYYTGAIYEIGYQNGKHIVSTEGNLSIAGITHIIHLPVTITVNTDETITCVGSTTIKMSDFGVRLPEVLVRNMEIGNEVKVNFNIILAPKPI